MLHLRRGIARQPPAHPQPGQPPQASNRSNLSLAPSRVGASTLAILVGTTQHNELPALARRPQADCRSRLSVSVEGGARGGRRCSGDRRSRLRRHLDRRSGAPRGTGMAARRRSSSSRSPVNWCPTTRRTGDADGAGLRVAATPRNEIYVCEPTASEDAAAVAHESGLRTGTGMPSSPVVGSSHQK
jgi:hypothetical protein